MNILKNIMCMKISSTNSPRIKFNETKNLTSNQLKISDIPDISLQLLPQYQFDPRTDANVSDFLRLHKVVKGCVCPVNPDECQNEGSRAGHTGFSIQHGIMTHCFRDHRTTRTQRDPFHHFLPAIPANPTRWETDPPAIRTAHSVKPPFTA